MTKFLFKLEHVYIPRIKYSLSWVPFASRYLPLEPRVPSQQPAAVGFNQENTPTRASVVHQNNSFASETRDTFEVYQTKPDNSYGFEDF